MNPNFLSSDETKTYVKPEIDVLEVPIEGTSVICASATGEAMSVSDEDF